MLAPPAVTPVPAILASERSIAVLPFVNMSGDPDNEYFSDGISEEILNVLAGTPELQVAARTSSFSFKGKPMEVPEIAAALNVRMVLEGSVRRQGDTVRITAQLIDAQNGFHVWSQTYDRKLEDIFAIQDEIARAIGEELKVKIAGSSREGKGAGGPPNLASHDLYLRGMALWHTRGEQELWDAIAAFEEAAALDPKSAQAFAGLALAYSVVGGYSARVPFAETWPAPGTLRRWHWRWIPCCPRRTRPSATLQANCGRVDDRHRLRCSSAPSTCGPRSQRPTNGSARG